MIEGGDFTMKTLEVASLLSGLDSLLAQLDSQEKGIQKIHSDVNGVIGLEDSLKGEGGEAIRSFYDDCHIPFLTFYQSMLEDYKHTLNNIKSALQAFESSSTGVIRENFLQTDLSLALNKAATLTSELTNETNQVIHSVNDIVTLPSVEDNEFLSQVSLAEKKIDDTLEQLHRFDYEQTNNLDTISESSQIALGYVEQIDSMFRSKEISINGYQAGSLFEKLTSQTIHSPVASTNSNIVASGSSTSERAMSLLLAYESNKGIESTESQDELEGLLLALKNGAMGAFAPLAIMTAVHKTGLLRIEYTKKKNHYTFKYNQKVLKVLKGKAGPKWSRLLIQKINRISKRNRNIERSLKAQKKNVLSAKKPQDVRTPSEKFKGKVWKMATGNRPLHENIKSKVIKNTSREMVIAKGAFKKIAAKTSGIGAAIIGTYSAVSNIANRWDVGNLPEKEKYEARGRVVGEEVNKVAGSVTGATAGAYVGAVIGGALSGPFAPFGAAAGAVVGSVIGGAVGEWASKYTNKWMSDAGAAVGKTIHNVKESAKGAIEGAKNALNDAKDALFGWL